MNTIIKKTPAALVPVFGAPAILELFPYVDTVIHSDGESVFVKVETPQPGAFGRLRGLDHWTLASFTAEGDPEVGWEYYADLYYYG